LPEEAGVGVPPPAPGRFMYARCAVPACPRPGGWRLPVRTPSAIWLAYILDASTLFLLCACVRS
jgi:hypothetical protein